MLDKTDNSPRLEAAGAILFSACILVTLKLRPSQACSRPFLTKPNWAKDIYKQS
jgi:hypothetical protein